MAHSLASQSMRYPEAYSNNTTITPTLGADSGTSGSGGGGGWSSGGGGGGYSRGLNVKAQISVERLPFDYSIENIRTIFGRYGRISRVVCDYRISEERLYVWIDYEDERVVENALRNENGRKVERSTIIVQKCQNSGSDGDSYRKSANKDAWGNKSFGSRGGGNSNSFSSGNDALDWGSSDAAFDSTAGESDDRRGRGGSRGDRRGGRGGRGRGGGRYQPYEKAEPANWDDVVSGTKPSTSSDFNSGSGIDWGAAGDSAAKDDWGNSDNTATTTTTNQSTSQSSAAADPFGGWD